MKGEDKKEKKNKTKQNKRTQEDKSSAVALTPPVLSPAPVPLSPRLCFLLLLSSLLSGRLTFPAASQFFNVFLPCLSNVQHSWVVCVLSIFSV